MKYYLLMLLIVFVGCNDGYLDYRAERCCCTCPKESAIKYVYNDRQPNYWDSVAANIRSMGEMRKANADDYKAFLAGYKGKKFYQYNYAFGIQDNWYITTGDSVVIIPLYGSASCNLIISKNTKVIMGKEGAGHSELYYMKTYKTNWSNIEDLEETIPSFTDAHK